MASTYYDNRLQSYLANPNLDVNLNRFYRKINRLLCKSLAYKQSITSSSHAFNSKYFNPK